MLTAVEFLGGPEQDDDPTLMRRLTADDLPDWAQAIQGPSRQAVMVGASVPTGDANPLVLIDSRVLDVSIESFRLGDDVLVIDGQIDGLNRISAEIASRTSITSIHLVTHGDSTGFWAGSTFVDQNVLAERGAQFAAWGNSLTDSADVLIYGCHLGASAEGVALVSEFARLTGADVAVSVDATGPEWLGANWSLEYATGPVESSTNAVAQALEATLEEPLWSVGGLIGGRITTVASPVFDVYEAVSGDVQARDQFNSNVGKLSGAIDAVVGLVTDPFIRAIMEKNLSKYISDPEWEEFLPANGAIENSQEVYYVNGIMTTRDDAVQESRQLAEKLGRPVRLIYNGTSNVAEVDLYEALKDKFWTPPVWQHNATTKQVAGLLYHAARAKRGINIIGHSQGAFIVNNAIRTVNAFQYNRWVMSSLATVLSGASMNYDGPSGSALFHRLDSPGDALSELLGARLYSVIHKLGGLYWGTPHYAERHNFAKSYISKINNGMFFGRGRQFDDGFEPNNDRSSAHDLGVASVYSHVRDFFQRGAIEPGADQDWFRFTVDNAVLSSKDYFTIEFDHTAAQLDVEVHLANGQTIRSTGTGDLREIRLDGVGPGQHFVRVFSADGRVAPYAFHYEFAPRSFPPDRLESNDTFRTATGLGRMAIPGQRIDIDRRNLSIHNATDRDYFKLDLLNWAGQDSYVEITFDDSQGDLDLSLHAVRDGRMSRIAISDGTEDSERILLDYRPADTYYVQVFGSAGAATEYDLKIVSNGVGLPPDSDEPNDSLSQAAYFAYNFSDTTLEYVGTGRDATARLVRATDFSARTNRTVHSTSDHDWYQLKLLAWGRSGDYVAISDFLHRQGDLELELYDKTGKRLASSTTSKDFEAIGLEGLEPDDYYVHIYGYNRALNWYKLSTSFVGIKADVTDRIGVGDTLQTAVLQEFIAPGERASRLEPSGTIHDAGDEDWYKFIVSGSTTPGSYIAIDYEPQPFADVNYGNDGGDLDAVLVDAQGTVLATSNDTTGTELFDVGGLPVGTYYVKVFGYAGDTNWYGLRYDIGTKRPGGIAGFGGAAFDYLENSGPRLLNPGQTASLVDPDNTTGYAGARLRVSLTSEDYRDLIRVRSQGTSAGQIAVVGNQILFGGQVIATRSDSFWPDFTFHASATREAITALLRNLTFEHPSDSPIEGIRTVSLRFQDAPVAGGGTSEAVTQSIHVRGVPDRPEIRGLNGDRATYTEGSTPAALDVGSFADVLDGDDPLNFAGGKVIAQIIDNGSLSDRLAVTGFWRIVVSGSQIIYDDSVIGTTSPFVDGFSPLVITLTDSATPWAVGALIRSLTFANVSNRPSTAERTVRVTVSDSAGGLTSDPVFVRVVVLPRNDPPELAGLAGGNISYVENAPGALLDPEQDATVTDPDLPDHFDGGKLVVRFTQGGSFEDRLEIGSMTIGGHTIQTEDRDGDGIRELRFDDVIVGWVDGGGSGFSPFTVSFNAQATPAVVQEVVRSVSFRNTSEAPRLSLRKVEFVLHDGQGGVSAPALVEVSVSALPDAPVITRLDGDSTVYVEDSAGQGVDTGALADVNDPDQASSIGGGVLRVELSGTVSAEDELFIQSLPSFYAIGNELFHEDTIVATRSGGQDGDPLEIRFTDQASVSVAKFVLWTLRFRNLSQNPTPGERIARITLSDEDNGPVSEPAFVTIQIEPRNDAPVLHVQTGFQLDAITEDPIENPGTLVKDLLASAGDPPGIDPDGTPLEGIAVTHVNTYDGRWEFSLDNGAQWRDLGRIYTSLNARLLAADDATRLRFVPKRDFHGTLSDSLEFALWDGTGLGFNGDTEFAYWSGNTAPFSREEATAAITVTPVADPPEIGGLEGDEANYVIGGGAVGIDVGARAEVDNPDNALGFEGGRLTVRVQEGGQPSDRLFVRTGAFTLLEQSGADLMFDGEVIGRVTGGDNSHPLQIDFTADASDRAVSVVLWYIEFESASFDTSLIPREIEVSLTGSPNGPALIQTSTVQMRTRNDLPVVFGLAGQQPTYVENGAPVLLDQWQMAEVVVPDGSSLAGQTLIVEMAAGAEAGDRLSLLESTDDPLSVEVLSAGEVRVGETVIGALEQGSYPQSRFLKLTLNDAATTELLSAAVRRLTFSHDSDRPSPQTRDLRVYFQTSEGLRGSAAAIQAVVVPVVDEPQFVNLDNDVVVYRPGSPPMRLDTGEPARVLDPDRADRSGAVLSVHLTDGAAPDDRLQVVPSFALTQEEQRLILWGNHVGTLAGGQGADPLVVTFTDLAAPADFDYVLRQLAFSNGLGQPAQGPRTVRLAYRSAPASQPVEIDTVVHVIDDVPTIENADGTSVTFTENDSGVRLLPSSVALLDPDNSPNYDGARLTARFIAGENPGDALRIDGNGIWISLDGNQVIYSEQVIGTWSGGIDGQPLEILFTDAATQLHVERVLRVLMYANSRDDLTDDTRHVRFEFAQTADRISPPVNSTVHVVPLNDQPVLATAAPYQIEPIHEDDAGNPGTLVREILASGGGMTDPDGDPHGIALASCPEGWQFSLDGGDSWAAITCLPSGEYLPLAADDQTRLRYVPPPNFAGPIPSNRMPSFFAWDGTSGEPGVIGTIEIDSYSVWWQEIEGTVIPQNDPPALNEVDGTNVATEENSFSFLVTPFSNVTDVDAPSDVAGWSLSVRLIGPVATGEFLRVDPLYSAPSFELAGDAIIVDGVEVGRLAGGTGNVPLVAVFNSEANLSIIESVLSTVQFVAGNDAPDAAPRTAKIVVRDAASPALSATARVTVRVTARNDEPVIASDTTLWLDPIAEDDVANQGTLLKALLSREPSLADPDETDSFGIAISYVPNTHGTWQYSLNDAALWQNLPDPLPDSQFLLAGDSLTRLRFVPETDYSGVVPSYAALSARIWDQTSGTPGTLADPTSDSISFSTVKISVEVLPQNDPPQLADFDDGRQRVYYEDFSAISALGFVWSGNFVDPEGTSPGGQLLLDIAHGAEPGDRLFIRSTAALAVRGNELVTSGDEVLATFVETADPAPSVTMTLSRAADAYDLRDLANTLYFIHDSQSPSDQPRTLRMRWSDGPVTADGLMSHPAMISLTVQPSNDRPTDILLQGDAVDEQIPGAIVGPIVASDPDQLSEHVWTVSDDRFEVRDGLLRLKANQQLQVQAEPSIDVQIRATDSGDLSISRLFTIRVRSRTPEIPDALSVVYADGTPPVFTWRETANARIYNLRTTSDSAGAMVVENFTGIDASEFALPTTYAAGIYYAFIQAEGEPGFVSAFSDPVSFAIADDNRPTWQNPFNEFDVDGRNGVTPLDVLTLINYINSQPGTSALPAFPEMPPPYYDVNGDSAITPLDVLTVINHINSLPRAAGEGELNGVVDFTSAEPYGLNLAIRICGANVRRVHPAADVSWAHDRELLNASESADAVVNRTCIFAAGLAIPSVPYNRMVETLPWALADLDTALDDIAADISTKCPFDSLPYENTFMLRRNSQD